MKSSYSGDSGGCVEVTVTEDGVSVRDSKNPGGAVLAYTDHEWDVFVRSVKEGEFDRERLAMMRQDSRTERNTP
nr:DUF397 domain-containing protein [Bailinhaonella thermotolerans]